MTKGMHMDLSKLLLPVILFVLTLGFGLWLSLSGKPYNGLLFNIHKLLALGAVILAGVQVYNLMKSLPPQGRLLALIVVTVLCAVALFASGAFLSIGKLNAQVLLNVHRIAIAVAIICVAAAIALLSRKVL